MGKDYIDTPGGFRDEAEDYDNDIVEYTLSNMGRKDFEALKAWWENNVQESSVNEADMTKFYDGFKVLNDKTGEMTKFKYIKGTSNVKVENEAIAKLMKATGLTRPNFGVHGFVKKGEWNKDDTQVLESKEIVENVYPDKNGQLSSYDKKTFTEVGRRTFYLGKDLAAIFLFGYSKHDWKGTSEYVVNVTCTTYSTDVKNLGNSSGSIIYSEAFGTENDALLAAHDYLKNFKSK